jgi:hypothetical protein
MILRDVDVLSKAVAEERDPVMELRSNPVIERTELYRNKEVHLFYHLKLSNKAQP